MLYGKIMNILMPPSSIGLIPEKTMNQATRDTVNQW
jgi:hypothetical protein